MMPVVFQSSQAEGPSVVRGAVEVLLVQYGDCTGVAELKVVLEKESVALTVTPVLEAAEIPDLEAEAELLVVLDEVFPAAEVDWDSVPVEEDPSETGPTALELEAVVEPVLGAVVAEVMAAVVFSPTTMVIVMVPGLDNGPVSLVSDDDAVVS